MFFLLITRFTIFFLIYVWSNSSLKHKWKMTYLSSSERLHHYKFNSKSGRSISHSLLVITVSLVTHVSRIPLYSNVTDPFFFPVTPYLFHPLSPYTSVTLYILTLVLSEILVPFLLNKQKKKDVHYPLVISENDPSLSQTDVTPLSLRPGTQLLTTVSGQLYYRDLIVTVFSLSRSPYYP